MATVGGSDIDRTAQVLTMTGPGVGAVVAYGVDRRGALVGLPDARALRAAGGAGRSVLVVGPLLRRLERAESVYRQQQGELTARAGDIVAGLRVLAGVGGRDLFARRYAARSQEPAAPRATGSARSTAGSTRRRSPSPGCSWRRWCGCRPGWRSTGEITVGELVAVYGYVATLIVPVWFLLEGGHQLIRGRVAARRIVALLNVPDDVAARAPVAGPGPAAGALPRRPARPTCTTRRPG